MGLLNRKPSSDETDGPLHFFDEYFREELRRKGREYFEKVIDENGLIFKKDLNATVTQVNADLKDHVTKQLDEAIEHINTEVNKQLDEQFVEFGKSMKEAQDEALKSLNQKAEALLQQHQQLADTLQKSVAAQEASMAGLFENNKARITAMNEAQVLALQWMSRSVKSLEEQNQQLGDALQKSVTSQKELLVNGFEQNMAQVIEHYLLGALGEQYDLKAQLPSIMKQMEANKDTMVEDIKL